MENTAGAATGPDPEPSRSAFSADPLRACRATEDLPFPGRQGPGFPWVKTPETRAHRCRRAGMRRKGSAHMPPETRAHGAPRTLLPEARAAARTRCRRGRPAVRTALMWPPHWEGTPATAWDASCVLKTHSGFSTPCAAEETLNSLKMGNILGRKSRFYLFQKHIDIIKSVDSLLSAL